MGRPKIDVGAVRDEILARAEAQLRDSGGERLRLADIAGRMGRAPSYVHLHFRTKHDLVAALAERWFAAVENAVREADAAAGSSEEALRAQVLAMLAVKRAKLDADPELFHAYLRLAGNHMELARAHVARLRELLRARVAEIVDVGSDGMAVERAVDLVEDATVQFRVPHMIALYPERATPERAQEVLAMLLARLGHRECDAS